MTTHINFAPPPEIDIEALARQQQDGFCLDHPFYNNREIFERDIELIFLRHWNFAGHTARIPNAGDYFLLDIAGESVIIARGMNGEVNALLNVCRHRGSLVCLESSGSAKAFSCPYHAWTYGLDGHLISAKAMSESFDNADFGLKQFAVHVVAGLIYIHLGEAPQLFETIAADAAHYLAPYALDKTRIAHRQVWTVDANWKLTWENFVECYHCGPAHPEYCSVMAHAIADTVGSKRSREAYVAYTEEWEHAAEERGLLTGSLIRTDTQMVHSCNRHPIKPGFLTQSRDGQPVAPLLGDLTEYDGGTSTFSLYPGHFVTATCDHAVVFRFTPQEALRTEVELMWLVRDDAREGVDYNVEELTWVWMVTTDQDKKIVDDNQAGVNSRFYQPGPYAECEKGVRQFIRWYLGQVG